MLTYVTRTWLPRKERFVKAWTKQHLHFGNVVASKAEGAHSILQKHLEVCRGILYKAQKKIYLVIEIQFHDVKTSHSIERVCVPYLYNILFFLNIGHVSHFALSKLFEQLKITSKETNQFTSSMGLPCAHAIK